MLIVSTIYYNDHEYFYFETKESLLNKVIIYIPFLLIKITANYIKLHSYKVYNKKLQIF